MIDLGGEAKSSGDSSDALLAESAATKSALTADLEVHPQETRLRSGNIRFLDIQEGSEDQADAEASSLLHADVETGGHDVDYSSPKTNRHWASQARSFWRRIVPRFREPSTPSQLPGFFKVLRLIFNYPEPGLELRSTAWLDGLRGLAAFEVFIFHYGDGWIMRRKAYGDPTRADMPAYWYTDKWYFLPVIRTFWASGDAAVCLFFAISGYVLSYRLLKLARQQRYDQLLTSLSSAIFRRAIRLYTPVLAETLILMLLCRWFGLPKPIDYEPAASLFLEFKTWFQSFVQLLLPLRYPDRFDKLMDRYDGGISWTIPLEYYGSLYVYTAVLFICRAPSIYVRRSLIAVMVLQSLIKDDWIAAQFVMGMAFADYQLERESRAAQQQLDSDDQPRWRRWLRPVCFICLFLFGFYLSGYSSHYRNEFEGDRRLAPLPFFEWVGRPVEWLGFYKDLQGDRDIQCFAALFSLIGIGETPGLRRILETRPIQYLGRISFGLYLCHIFVRAWLAWLPALCITLVGLDPLVQYKDRPDSENGRMFVAFLMNIVVSAFFNFLVGGMFERWLDKPSVSAGRLFERWCLSWGNNKAQQAGEPELQMQEVAVGDQVR